MEIAVDIMRMIERLAVVLGGIVSIYLGYRLFIVASLPSDSGAKIKAKAIEITVTKIGPGIFFAGLGSFILWSAMKQPIEHERYEHGFLKSRDMLKPAPEFKYDPSGGQQPQTAVPKAEPQDMKPH